MSSQGSFNKQQNLRQYTGMNDLNYYQFKNNSFSPIYNNQQKYYGSTKASNEVTSNESDSSFSYKKSNVNYEKPKNADKNQVILKPQNEFVKELFKAFGEKNSLCNFSLFEKNIDINMNLDQNIVKKITLLEYFECFNEASFLCLNIPFLDKKGNITHNLFYPTLSSLYLILNNEKIKEENINKQLIKENYSISFLPDHLIKIEYDETNPPYNRDIIETKINLIHKILGKKKILLNNIMKEKSHFSVLWTPADTYKIKSSFLSYYTFDFKLIGTLIIKMDEYTWFTTFCNDGNSYKDFKKEYLNKINVVENYIKKALNINDRDNFEHKLFSHDYKRFIYNF